MTKEELEKKAENSYWDSEASGSMSSKKCYVVGYIAGAKENGVKWHDLRTNPDDLPEVNMLVRIRLSSGMEHICETDYYEPSEDEIGYGKLILSFYELDGEWIDDTEIIAWCEIPKFKE